jgi:hypothetical protein
MIKNFNEVIQKQTGYDLIIKNVTEETATEGQDFKNLFEKF